MKAFFNGDIKNEILVTIKGAVKNIHAAIYRFNDLEIYEALRDARKRGVDIWILLAEEEGNHALTELVEDGAHVYKITKEPKLLHHKFFIADRKNLITGSYNWTNGAFHNNYENIIKIENAYELCNDFLDEFDKIRERIDQMVKTLVEQVLAEEKSMISMLSDYVRFVTEYVEKYKKIPPKEILNQFYKDTHKSGESAALTIIPNVKVDSAALLVQQHLDEVLTENWWNGLSSPWKFYFNNVVLKRGINTKVPSNFLEIFNKKALILDRNNTSFPGKVYIFDLQGLSELVMLESLFVENVSIRTLTPLNKLKKLRYLGVSDCSLENIRGIESLTALEEFYCAKNAEIDTLEGIEDLPNLKMIVCDYKFVSFQTECTRLKTLGFTLDYEAMKKEKDVAIWVRK